MPSKLSYRRALSLPLFPGMTDDDVAQVVDALGRATRLAAPRPYARVIG